MSPIIRLHRSGSTFTSKGSDIFLDVNQGLLTNSNHLKFIVAFELVFQNTAEIAYHGAKMSSK
jgi:hypothetical protein